MNKPPVLSDKEIEKWCSEHKAGKGGICYVSNSCEICRRTIQRDADVEWYEKHQKPPIIGLDPSVSVEQARQDTAREIFEELYAKCSVEAQHIDSNCGWDRLIIRRYDLQSLKDRYKEKK